MKFFVSGVGGQLGHDVMNELHKRGHGGVGSDLAPVYSGVADGSFVEKMPYLSLDITDEAAVARALEAVKPDVVVHCAAWTAVDAAEEEENAAKVRAVNVDGTRYLAENCRRIGAKMIYLSTDYVFDGAGTQPWQPDCKAYKPLNVYGPYRVGVREKREEFYKDDAERRQNARYGAGGCRSGGHADVYFRPCPPSRRYGGE